MTDLFQSAKKQPTNYTAKDIEVLEGLEPVRKRPGMYIGGTDEKAMHHLVAEVLDNSMDEAVAGYATRIEVRLEPDNIITITDNGRGIPTDPHPKHPEQSALEVIFTTLHAGGKFNTGAYETAGGLHGVGISVVNALSDSLEVTVWRQRRCWTQRYGRGKAQSELQEGPGPANRRGTAVKFHPDPEIFGDKLTFKPLIIYRMLQAKAYLFKGVQIDWKCDASLVDGTAVPSERRFHYPNGLLDFMKDKLSKAEIVGELFAGEAPLGSSNGESQGRVEWAVAFPEESSFAYSSSFCNTIPTPLGGSHESGFRTGCLKAFKELGERSGNKGAAKITADDIFADNFLVLSCFIPNPQFQGQTKEKLATPQAARLIEAAVKDRIDLWLSQHPAAANAMLERVVETAEERLRRKQSKDVARASAVKRLRLPGKLADCQSKDKGGTEIFLVEGDSAGGSAKQARDRATQAVLPLRGKILNVANASLDKLRANQELADLTQAIGCGIGKDCDPEQRRYDRIVIMTDADVDGAHIASLLLTFFIKEMTPLVKQGHVYLACPPLYKLSQGSKTEYAVDEAERDKLMKKVFKSGRVDISRFKGLGEMRPQQLRDTTMKPSTRRLLRVRIEEGGLGEHSSLQEIFEFVDKLMGRNPQERYNFIQDNALAIDGLDV